MAEISNELLEETCDKMYDAIDHLRAHCMAEFDRLTSNFTGININEYEQQLERGDKYAYKLSVELQTIYNELIQKVE
jgi:hypothetical protein